MLAARFITEATSQLRCGNENNLMAGGRHHNNAVLKGHSIDHRAIENLCLRRWSFAEGSGLLEWGSRVVEVTDYTCFRAPSPADGTTNSHLCGGNPPAPRPSLATSCKP